MVNLPNDDAITLRPSHLGDAFHIHHPVLIRDSYSGRPLRTRIEPGIPTEMGVVAYPSPGGDLQPGVIN